jgi:hypothetical protein
LYDVSEQVLDFAVLFGAPETAVGVVALRSKRNWDVIFACKYESVFIAIRNSHPEAGLRLMLDESYLAEDLQGEDKSARSSIHSLGSHTRHILLNRITDEVKSSLAKESVLSSVMHRMVVVPERPSILRVRVICPKRNA